MTGDFFTTELEIKYSDIFLPSNTHHLLLVIRQMKEIDRKLGVAWEWGYLVTEKANNILC